MTPMKTAPTASRRAALALLPILAASLAPLARAQAAPAAGPSAPAVSPSTLPFNGIAHIAIRVNDIAASVAFYNKLGFEQAFAMTKGDVVTQSFVKLNDKQFIELYPINPANPTQDKPEFLHLCLEGVDLNAIHDAYVAEGLTPIAVRTAGAGNLLFTMKGPLQFRDPQNIEYTQYMPGSLHSKDIGLHLGAGRIADKMIVVDLAMQDPAAARAYYSDKLGFVQVGGGSRLAWRFGLPGTSGQMVEIVPVESLGAKSSITLTAIGSLAKVQESLKAKGVAFTATKSDVTVTDPDGNLIHIVAAGTSSSSN
jgi:catechol 2,3-dioxygenase-like lactoylglutathione lyase family enzyme